MDSLLPGDRRTIYCDWVLLWPGFIQETQCAHGLINTTWSGTVVEQWMRHDLLAESFPEKHCLSNFAMMLFITLASAADGGKGAHARTAFPKPDRLRYDGHLHGPFRLIARWAL